MPYEFSIEDSATIEGSGHEFSVNVLVFSYLEWKYGQTFLGSFEWVHQLPLASILERFGTSGHDRTRLVGQNKLICAVVQEPGGAQIEPGGAQNQDPAELKQTPAELRP